MLLKSTSWSGVAAAAVLLASSAGAAEWGTIKGKLVYEGKPENKPIQVNKDVEYCSQHKPVEETIVVGDGNGLQNAFIYLYTARNQKVAVHPDYDEKNAKPKVLDNKGCRFEPHAMTLWTAEPLEIHNSDEGIGHNTNAQTLAENTRFNEQVTSDSPITKKMTKSEPRPATIACNVHPWMNAYVLIRDNPYMAVTGPDGSFEIKNVPAGKQEFAFWHEAKGYMRDLEVGDEETDRKGQVELVVPAGKTLDLGEIKVSARTLGQ